LRDCRNKGYRVSLIYLWLPSPDLAVARVARRVASGGHSIPEAVIRRRYERGRRNLVNLYLPLCDAWTVYENSGAEFRLIAGRVMDREAIVYDNEVWEQINGSADD
jgi:predicted ABC-type ATPase